MTVSLNKILAYYGITDILKEAFLKTYKPSPPIFLVKYHNCSEQLS